jgi:putative transposase
VIADEEVPMNESASKERPIPTIWRVPDELWEKNRTDSRRARPAQEDRTPPHRDQRAALDAIIFRMRSGCQWNRLPEEFPDDSSVHRTFQRWVELGLLDRIWAASIEECKELGGVDWEWQAADTAMGKARFGGNSSAQTPPTGLKTA